MAVLYSIFLGLLKPTEELNNAGNYADVQQAFSSVAL